MKKTGMIMRAFVAFAVMTLFTSPWENMLLAQGNTLKIGFSKAGPDDKYKMYISWMQQAGKDIECVDMSSMTAVEAAKALEDCDGLVLTGGPDIFPGLYKKEAEISRCEKIDRVRDGVELALIRKAMEAKMPIFAICRGAQLMNISQGGNLLTDISADRPSDLCHRLVGGGTCWHDISIMPGTPLSKLFPATGGKVNSFHHQAVDRIASVFVPVAKSPDGLIEAFTWKDPQDKPFLIALQWHPERMSDSEDFSMKPARKFLEEAKAFSILRH